MLITQESEDLKKIHELKTKQFETKISGLQAEIADN